MQITKRGIIRTLSYLLAAIAVVVTYIAIFITKINDYKTQIEYSYSMNLNELDGSLNNISIALQKAVYASSATQLSTIATELCTESTVAKNSLSQLPYSGQTLNNVNKFLSQVGDYTLFLSKKVIQGSEVTDSEREQLHNMSQTAQKISQSVDEVRIQYDKNGVWNQNLNENIENSVDADFNVNMTELEEMLADYPSLVYDGPFSDHMLNGKFKMLENKESITVEAAREKAAEIFNVDIEKLMNYTETDGNIDCYNFDSEEMSISVTKLGGFVVYMRKYHEIGEHKISYDDAVKKALEYINSNSDGKFVATYYFADEGVCTVNLAYKEGATVCYPDLIKIGVALDTGEVVMLEAASYIANHYTRTISTPEYTAADAKQVLSKALTVESVKRAIIPISGNVEKHCYEFTCRGINDEELLIYVNVKNLEEEKILLLLKTDGGTLTK